MYIKFDLITGVSVYASLILRNDIYTTENLIMNNFYRLEAYFFKLIVQYFSKHSFVATSYSDIWISVYM